MNIYLTAVELSERIKYDVRYIREHLKDKVFVEGIHYMRPFGGRKILFIWSEMLFRVYSKFIPKLTRQDGSAFESLLRKKLEDNKKDTEGEEK